MVAYALVGDMNVDISREPLGQDQDGNDVYLKDIWPTSKEVAELVEQKDSGKNYVHISDDDDSTDVRCQDIVVLNGNAYFSLLELSMGDLGVFKVSVSDLFDGKVKFSWPPFSSVKLSTFKEFGGMWYGYGYQKENKKYVFYKSLNGVTYQEIIHQNLEKYSLVRKPYIDKNGYVFLAIDAAQGLAYSTNQGGQFEFLTLNSGFSGQENGLVDGLLIRDVMVKNDTLYVASKAGLVIAQFEKM